MRMLGNTVIFISVEPFFSREKSGAKPNTERIMSFEEYDWLLKHEPKITRIRIERFEMGDEYFENELTDISDIGTLLGNKMIVLSWKHEIRGEREEEDEML